LEKKAQPLTNLLVEKKGDTPVQETRSTPIWEFVETLAGQAGLLINVVLLSVLFMLLPHIAGEYLGSIGGYSFLIPFAIVGLAFILAARKEGLL